MAQDRALPHHIHRPQQRHRAAVHAQAQVLEVSDNQSDADHRHVLVRGLLRTAHHRQPALLGPLRGPVHRTPQGVVHRSGNVLERDTRIFHVGRQYGHQAHVPVDTRRTADGGAETAEHAGRNGLSEVPDQSPLLHEHAQQHPCADRHRHGIRQKRRDRAFENDALRALRFGTRNHLAQQGHPVHPELYRADAHPLHQRRGHPGGVSARPADAGLHSAAAADRLRGERIQARRELQQPVVHPHARRLRRRQGHRHDQQQPPHAERRKTQRRNRTGQCPQASGTDLRPPELRARHRRKHYDIHRKTRNTDPQCLSV